MKLKRLILLGFSIPILYLTSIAIWSSTHTNTLVSPYRAIQDVKLSERQKEILLTVEDPTFYNHWGLSISNGQGLTTITSSIVPQIFYRSKMEGLAGLFQSIYAGFYNCCKRIDIGRDIVALVLNSKISKDEQLQLYLKAVYMSGFEGKQYYGFEEASKAYYSKPINQLTEFEFIGLAAMPIAPNRYHPLSNAAQHKSRSIRISNLITGLCAPDGWLDLQYEKCEI